MREPDMCKGGREVCGTDIAGVMLEKSKTENGNARHGLQEVEP